MDVDHMDVDIVEEVESVSMDEYEANARNAKTIIKFICICSISNIINFLPIMVYYNNFCHFITFIVSTSRSFITTATHFPGHKS